MPRRILLILILAAAAFFGWRYYDRKTEENPNVLTLHGNIEIRQVDLGFRVPGRIEAMRFEEGDRARRGEVMSALDRRSYEDELRLAQAQRGAEAANLAKLEAGYRPEEVAQAKAQVAEREAVYDNAKRVFIRNRDLVGSKAVSRQAVEESQAAMDQAEAALRSAREAYALARKGFRVEEIEAARASLRAAEARVEQANTALADTVLYAPADGVVLTRVREPGAIVAAGTIVYTLSLDEPVWARAYVTEPNLGRVHPGMEALVYTDSRPNQPYKGQIGFISPVAEFTPKNVETTELRADLVYRLRVVVTDVDQGLRQGMPVTVVLQTGGNGRGGAGKEGGRTSNSTSGHGAAKRGQGERLASEAGGQGAATDERRTPGANSGQNAATDERRTLGANSEQSTATDRRRTVGEINGQGAGGSLSAPPASGQPSAGQVGLSGEQARAGAGDVRPEISPKGRP